MTHCPKSPLPTHNAPITAVIRRQHPGWNPPVDTGEPWIRTWCPVTPECGRAAAVSYELNGFNCLSCGARITADTLSAVEPLKVGDEFEDGTVVRIIRTNKDGSQVLELNTGRIAVRGNGVEITTDRDYTE